jgi:hypothetical protein
MDLTPPKRPRDWIYSCVSAAVLLVIATLTALLFHLNLFEGSITWFEILLPGAVLAAKGFLAAASVRPGTVIIVGSFLWYFAISYAAIKTYRLMTSRFFRLKS